MNDRRFVSSITIGVAVFGLLGCSAAMQADRASEQCPPRVARSAPTASTRLVAGGHGVAPIEVTDDGAGATGFAHGSSPRLVSGGVGVAPRVEPGRVRATVESGPTPRLVASPPGTPPRVECE